MRDLRNGIFCVLVFLACFWLAWPVAKMGFVDDWSYIKTAEVFARTGHLVYNGWATAMLGWMIPWGALFIKVFGFSFMTVKLSTLPLAAATLLLFHAILRRFEIGPRNAVIGTLTLGLSPLFLPLSASFMTDIPGLFVIVLCLYCCQRALAATTDKAAIAWLAAAAVSNVVGGTARQIAWLGVLVMVPCTGWLLRKRRGVLAASLALWLAGIGAVFYCVHWFAQQPYSVPLGILPKHLPSSEIVGIFYSLSVMDQIGAELLFLLLLVFPVLAAWLGGLRLGRRIDRYAALFCAAFLPLFAVKVVLGPIGEIWPPSMIYTELSVQRDAAVTWHANVQRSLLQFPERLIISFVVLSAFLACLVIVRRGGRKILEQDGGGKAREMFWLLAPYSAAYVVLLLPSAFPGLTFERYTLGLMPCAIAGSLWLYERYVQKQTPLVSVVFLVIFGVFSVAATHDWFAWQRARLAAIGELRAAGVPRTEIQGGFDYDGWTQVGHGGRVNDPRIRVPAGAYEPPKPPVAGLTGECKNWFLSELPLVRPRYSVAVMPARCYLPSRFAAVHYTSWLPPFRRTIEVQRFPDGGRGKEMSRQVQEGVRER